MACLSRCTLFIKAIVPTFYALICLSLKSNTLKALLVKGKNITGKHNIAAAGKLQERWRQPESSVGARALQTHMGSLLINMVPIPNPKYFFILWQNIRSVWQFFSIKLTSKRFKLHTNKYLHMHIYMVPNSEVLSSAFYHIHFMESKVILSVAQLQAVFSCLVRAKESRHYTAPHRPPELWSWSQQNLTHTDTNTQADTHTSDCTSMLLSVSSQTELKSLS